MLFNQIGLISFVSKRVNESAQLQLNWLCFSACNLIKWRWCLTYGGVGVHNTNLSFGSLIHLNMNTKFVSYVKLQFSLSSSLRFLSWLLHVRLQCKSTL